MEDFVKRIVDEEKEIKQVICKTTERVEKLYDFAEKVAESKVKVTDTERYLLDMQAKAMCKLLEPAIDYDHVLLARIALYEEYIKKEK